MKIKITFSGILFDEIQSTIVSEQIKNAFIIQATPAMIEDIPIKEKIEDELSAITFSKDKVYSITALLTDIILKKNKNKIIEYKNVTGNILTSYKLLPQSIIITKSCKTGAIVEENQLKEVKLLSLQNPHPVHYSRDFIGYYFEINALSTAILNFNNNIQQKASINFSQISLLAFKSENATNSTQSLRISKQILAKISGKEFEVLL